MMKYSIIVPLYNCEQYIEKCLESLLDQNYEGEYEVIVVNDGSVDGSLSIVQKISVSSKEKIKIVSQKNKGLSGARNTGLRMAIGQYIIFIDADDPVYSFSFRLHSRSIGFFRQLYHIIKTAKSITAGSGETEDRDGWLLPVGIIRFFGRKDMTVITGFFYNDGVSEI